MTGRVPWLKGPAAIAEWLKEQPPDAAAPQTAAYAMREPGLFEMPDYKDLPPGAKVLTSSIGDMLYVPLPEDERLAVDTEYLANVRQEHGHMSTVLLLVALVVGIIVGYFAGGVWG